MKELPNNLRAAIPSFLQIGLLGIAFIVFHYWFRILSEWAPVAFEQSIINPEARKDLASTPWLILPAIAIISVLALRWKLLATTWNTFEGGSSIRILVFVCGCMMAWIHLTYPYDYFSNESALLERSITVIFSILLFWRPAFIIPYLFLPIVLHFGEAVKVHNWSVTELPSRILILFCAQLLLWLVLPQSRWRSAPFIFMLFCIVAGNYFPSGLAKLKSDWLYTDHIYFLLPSMYPDGWLGFLSVEALSKLTVILSKFNWLLKIGTLLVEFGAIFILFRSKWIPYFLFGMLMFHGLVFASSGIFFWPWMTFHLVLIYFLWKKGPIFNMVSRYNFGHFLISLIVIGTAAKWLRPSIYVWGESRANYSYIFEVEDTNGASYRLPQYLFWPQYFEFSLSSFHYLHDQKTLPIFWGTTNNYLANRLTEMDNGVEILKLEKTEGNIYLNQIKKERFINYLRNILSDPQSNLPTNRWIKAITAPPQRNLFTPQNAYFVDQPIAKVTVHQLFSFFDGDQYQEIRRVPVLSFDLMGAKEH